MIFSPRFLLLLLWPLAWASPAAAQKSPHDGMYVDLGWTVGQTAYTTPYRGTAGSQYALGQPYFAYTAYDDKFMLQSDISGWADALRGYVQKLSTKQYNGSALSHHAVQSGATGYGRDISVGSFLYAQGSPHLKIGGQVAFYEFGVESPDHVGVLREDLETLLGLNLHYTRVLGSYSHLRVSLFGDRIFHQGGIRGYAGTGEVELRLHVAAALSLLADCRVRERAYAGQHTGTPSPFSPTDLTLVFPFGLATDNLPARALSQSLNVGLALLLGT